MASAPILRLLLIILFAIFSERNAEEVQCVDNDGCTCSESNSCMLNCDGTNDCRDMQSEYVLTCTTGDSCTVICSGINSCFNAKLSTNAASSVHVICDGKNSCKNMEVSCSPNNPCAIECNDSSACFGITVLHSETASTYQCSGLQCPSTTPPTLSPESIMHTAAPTIMTTTSLSVRPTLTVIASSASSSTSAANEQHVFEETTSATSNASAPSLIASQAQGLSPVWIWICVAVGGSMLCCLAVSLICLIIWRARQRDENEKEKENNRSRLPLKESSPKWCDLVDGVQLTLHLGDSGERRHLSDDGGEVSSQLQLEGVIENRHHSHQLNQDRSQEDDSDENQRLNVVTQYID
eukprot:CAMPEP_0202711234 /NCGR_PEP_ID=MMETSP1385-20130828/23078_1 /ASSEMBLY_ACC=CAM_ASM_000861 /TAXON_ID=933848 /ORGANISM="Elphidium margaritaceum" /LENGTH=351 /DNA_ID=CAMNT_0049370921 /DNA_START=21 /DNA_END=1076 /DNA_ORIENTATION=+